VVTPRHKHTHVTLQADPHYLRITGDGQKAFLSLTAAAKVLYLDLSDPAAITIIGVSAGLSQ
jgi:hypothetical protein